MKYVTVLTAKFDLIVDAENPSKAREKAVILLQDALTNISEEPFVDGINITEVGKAYETEKSS